MNEARILMRSVNRFDFQKIAFFSLLLVVFACGQSGTKVDRQAKPSPSPSPKPVDPSLGLTTNIGIYDLTYEHPSLTSCLQRGNSTAVVHYTVTNKRLTGPLRPEQVWPSGAEIAVDPPSDARNGNDIHQVFAGSFSGSWDGLRIGLTGAFSEQPWFLISLGGVRTHDGVLDSRLAKRFLVSGERIYERENARWEVIVGDQGSVKVAGQDNEMLAFDIEERYLGNVLGWPLWWISIDSVSVPDGDILGVEPEELVIDDAVATTFFPSGVTGDFKPFEVTSCSSWASQSVPFEFVQITPKSDDWPLKAASEYYFQIVRAAFDTAVSGLGISQVGLGRMNVIAVPYDAAAVPAGVHGTHFENIANLYYESSADFPEAQLFENALTAMIDLLLGSDSAVLWPYGSIVRFAFTERTLQDTLGKYFWYNRIGSQSIDVDLLEQVTGPLALSDETPEQIHKAAMLGRLIAPKLDPQEIVEVWYKFVEAAGESEPEDAWDAAFAAAAPNYDWLSLWAGWLRPGDFAYKASSLLDTDGDGLADFIELHLDSDVKKVDTDGDGWTDFGEAVTESSPEISSINPAKIVADGSIMDWLQLIPKKIFEDKNLTGACPNAAEITHYTALANRDQLVVAGFSNHDLEAEFATNDEPAFRWEIALDFPQQNKQFLVQTKGPRGIKIKEWPSQRVLKERTLAYKLGGKSLEVFLDRKDFKVEVPDFNLKDAIKVHVRLFFIHENGRELCDESDWISPYISL
jgi:hypothetical protein